MSLENRLNFKNTLSWAKTMMEADIVPLIFGHTGVGKTSLVQEIYPDAPVVVILASLLKEGEIGGMPITRKVGITNFLAKLAANNPRLERVMKKRVVREEGKTTLFINDYTVHGTILRCLQLCARHETVILFIDEINRADRETMNELFSLILTKEIQGLQLPGNLKVIVAANPEETDETIDYGVNAMNAAFLNRFAISFLDTNIEEWLEWAQANNIHNSILEFLASNPAYLLKVESDRMVWPNHRAWAAFSRVLNQLDKEETVESDNYVARTFHGARSIVGTGAATAYRIWYSEKQNPIPTPEQLIADPDGIASLLENETVPRLYVMSSRFIQLLNDKYTDESKKITRKILDAYILFLLALPIDLQTSIIFDNARKYKDLHNDVLTEDTRYLNLFFENNKKLTQSDIGAD